MKKKYALSSGLIKVPQISFLFVIASAFQMNAQTTVDSLSELQEVIQNSNQEIVMESGEYNLEDLDSDSRIISFSGSNNTVDLTGVHIEVPVGSIRESYILVQGSNNTIEGGEIEDVYRSGVTEITDFVAYHQDSSNLAYGLRGDAVMTVSGEGNLIDGLKLTARGSHLYGYGSMYGINQYNTFGMNKRCGLLINGAKNTLDNVEVQMRSFGHGIFMQGDADQTVIKNSLVEGRVRAYAELYEETDPESFPYRSDYKLPETSGTDYEMPFSESVLAIPTDEFFSLSEDGIRAYTGTGSVTVENCTVKKMRGGIRLYLGKASTVTNSVAIDCGSTNFNMATESTIVNSSGNFTYAPLSDFRLGRSRMNIEWTIIPSPNATGPHNIVDLQGNDHNIVFHRTPGPIDETTRAIVITGDNSTIVNETEYPIILEDGANGNTIISCGSVTDNGSNNDVESSNDCEFDELVEEKIEKIEEVEEVSFTPDPSKTYYIDSPYHDLRLAATGESEEAYTASTDATGEDVEWKFVDKGNGYWHIDRANGGSTPRLRTDNSEFADMQGTGWSGSYTYYNFTEGAINGTYFITLTDGPVDYQRLQVDRDGVVKMVASDHSGTWESFIITEVAVVNETPLRIEAEDYDGMSGVQAEVSTESGDNIGYIHDGDWLRFDDVNLSGFSNIDVRVASRFTGGTIEVRSGSTTGTLLGSISITNTGGNQDWITKNTSLSNATGTQDVYLVFTGDNGYLFNVNWIEFNTTTTTTTTIGSKNIIATAKIAEVIIYPNPIESVTTIQGAANSTIHVYDMNGETVFTKSISSESEIIDLSRLSSGIYYTEVQGVTGTTIIKIIKN